MSLPKSWITVTPFSKFLALLLFIALPFLGFYLGMHYQQKSAPVPNSGIYGNATLGPISPVQKVGDINDKPYQGSFYITYPNSDQKITTFSTSSSGAFRLDLPPGNYYIYRNSNLPPTLRPTPTTVSPGNYTQIDLMLDSGIR